MAVSVERVSLVRADAQQLAATHALYQTQLFTQRHRHSFRLTFIQVEDRIARHLHRLVSPVSFDPGIDELVVGEECRRIG